MYVKAINDVVIAYPYGAANLRQDNPQTSFPDTMSDELLAIWNVYPVQPVNPPDYDQYTQNLVENNPVLVDGVWQQSWSVEPATPEEILERRITAEKSVRDERDVKLAESDWVVIKSLELGQPIPQDWEAYRQSLRDIPQQPGFPFDVVWPIKPGTIPFQTPT